MSRLGRYMGTLAAVLELRARRLLRLIKKQARHQTSLRNESPDRAVVGTRRDLALVLRRPTFHGVARPARMAATLANALASRSKVMALYAANLLIPRRRCWKYSQRYAQ